MIVNIVCTGAENDSRLVGREWTASHLATVDVRRSLARFGGAVRLAVVLREASMTLVVDAPEGWSVAGRVREQLARIAGDEYQP